MLDQFSQLNEATGISVRLEQEGTYCLSGCRLIRKGSQVDIAKKVAGVPSLAELQKQLPAGGLVALNLSGKGVLIKEISKTEALTATDFSAVLPNANAEDFYMQQFISGSKSYVSLIRKQEADKWISRIRESGWNCLAMSLGPFPAEYILPQLNEYGSELIADGYQLMRDKQGHWQSCRYHADLKAPFALKLAGEGIDERLLLSYAAAFQLLLADRLTPIQAQVPELELALSAKLNVQRLKAKGVQVLLILFGLLLVNFGLLSYWTSANQRLAAQVSQSAAVSTNYEQLTAQIKQQEQQLQLLGWEGDINKSSLVDQLAQCLPPEVSLQQLSIDPLQQRSGEQQARFQFRTIRVIGTSAQLALVNEWLERIRFKPWVKQAGLENYSYDNEQNIGQFTLLIHY